MKASFLVAAIGLGMLGLSVHATTADEPSDIRQPELRDGRPRSMLKIEMTKVDRTKRPATDSHNQLGGGAKTLSPKPIDAAAGEPYRVRKTKDFKITGMGDNAAWAAAEWAMMPARKADKRVSRFKMLYSDRGLYVLMDGDDADITSTKKADFEDLWTEDVFEFFLWPDERWPVYFEYEISPKGHELVLLVPNFGGRDKLHGWRPWHYEGKRKIEKKVALRGPTRAMTGWTAEVFVPYDLLKPLQNVPPTSGTRWRANVYRCDYDFNRAVHWSWKPTGSSFHEIDRFGTLVFE
ncbi:MAG: carbohydrate-binding family 9-like protein [Pirellulales bacterium]|nr:carbohydrate-binding family 9-like protein [Pirellulales bacterium]